MRNIFSWVFIFAIIFLLISSCKKDEFVTGPVELKFSADTVIFDTVFTTVGSATQVFQVYNNSDSKVKISSIRLAKGENSNFRLNVDGLPGKTFNDVEIGANDSLFIFVEVTVDPNNINKPKIITDSILFITNGFMQDIDLVAWGQDAYYHSAPHNSQIAPFFFADTVNQMINWPSDKPHVIYGYLMIDSSQTFTISEGTNVYFHPGSGIIVLNTGTLLVNGTQQKNVTFQGDRLGADFDDVPGQWDRIWLSNLNLHTNIISPGTKNSSISYAVIKNGTIGLLVDTAFDNNSSTKTLHLDNTIVKNMSSNGVALRGSNVDAYNCVFANCGAQTTNIIIGGNYNFYHCTFANFWNNGQRQDPSVTLNNYYVYNNIQLIRQLNVYFGNSIIYGVNDNELGFDSAANGNQFNFRFDHVLLKVKSDFPTSDPSRYISIIKATNSDIFNPRFADVDNNNYKLDSLNSSAVDAGDINITLLNSILNFDILGTSRPQRNGPDLGAYERQ